MGSWFLIVGGITIYAGARLAWLLAGGDFKWDRRTISRSANPVVFWLAVTLCALILAVGIYMISVAAPDFGH